MGLRALLRQLKEVQDRIFPLRNPGSQDSNNHQQRAPRKILLAILRWAWSQASAGVPAARCWCSFAMKRLE
ncbi:hypothetical protein XENTR_v10006053 [Xenopus tropicalis]|nr:hypothetical protein XENTR_v10006053 [Xenopus tropicalis]